MPPKAIPIDRTNIQVSAEDLIKTKLSTESLRVAISYMNHPKLLAGIYPQKIANWMVAKVDEVASFVSQLQASDPTPAEQHNSTLPPCMDFLISSGVEKVFRATIQEIHAFEGLRAPLVQHVLRGQKFAHWLNVLLTTTKQIVKQDPEFLNDFERNFRKCLLIWIIKEVQRSMDCNLRQQFAL